MQCIVCTDKHHSAETSVAKSVSRTLPGFRLLSEREAFRGSGSLEKGSQPVWMKQTLARVQFQYGDQNFLGKSASPISPKRIRMAAGICLT